jgi:F-type H+-transporting ATPase subunit epsilon
MENLFEINILTPEKTAYKGKAYSLVVPAELGYLGVLANHAPLIAHLVPGKIIFKEESGKLTMIYSKGKGFLEVLNNNATLLVDGIQ